MSNIITMLINGVRNGTISTFQLIILLLTIIVVSIVLYKNTPVFKAIYNFLANLLPLIKRKYVIVVNFSKQSGNIDKVIEKYLELGCKTYRLNACKRFDTSGNISKEKLEKIIRNQQKTISQAKGRLKTPSSFIYIGFPHVPLGFLDGLLFNDTDMPILYEHQHEDCEHRKKGFFELEKIYNTNLQLVNDIDKISFFGEEIALKIEQSFNIDDKDINKIFNDIQIIKFGLENITRSGISNYSQIDLYKKEFDKLLATLKNKGVKKIHLFATTPVSLSFSLGNIIKHYHPEIIVYNYNRGEFDWAVNLKYQEVIMCDDIEHNTKINQQQNTAV